VSIVQLLFIDQNLYWSRIMSLLIFDAIIKFRRKQSRLFKGADRTVPGVSEGT
jgi:hypothetical protein